MVVFVLLWRKPCFELVVQNRAMSAVFILLVFIIHQYFLKCKNLYEIFGKILFKDSLFGTYVPNNSFLKENNVDFS